MVLHVKKRRVFGGITTLAALLCVGLATAGLIGGADWLTATVPGLPGLPLGNLATWLGLVSLAWLALRMAGPGRLRGMAQWLLALAGAWLPLGALIAGNWALSFRGNGGFYVWAGATALLALTAVLTLLAVAFTWWLRRRSKLR